MASLLDFMTPEDKQKALERGAKRLAKNKNSAVSPELFVIAEFGYYFGFEGIMAIKRGYIETIKDGELVQEPFTLEEVLALIEAAKKVWYSKVIEQSHGNMIASAAKFSANSGETFNKNMKPFMDKADLNGGNQKETPKVERK